jgi:hypothetical protein
MKAVSFWGLCRVTIHNYIDRMARNLHRHVSAANAEIFSSAVGEGSRRKRIVAAISARRAFRLRAAEVKVAARKPLAGVAVNGDD